MIFICLKPQYKITIWRDVAASRQLAPEVIMVMFVSTLDAPRRGWDLWRFASLIPSGCRLTPIHKVMGDHASMTPPPPGLVLRREFRGWCERQNVMFSVVWRER